MSEEAGHVPAMPRALNAASGTVVAERLRPAHTHWTRLKGLLGTSALDAGDGLWLKPCRQVHMIGMRYPVDLAFLDECHRVVRAISALAPGRISPRIARAESVLELPAGTLTRTGLMEGSQVAIEGVALPAASGRRGWPTLLCNLALAALFGFFASAHLSFALRTGQWASTMPIVTQEALLVVLFLTRRQSLATSRRPADWAAGVAGSVLPLFMRAADTLGPLSVLGRPVQILALVLATVSTATLGRSFGVVAANRGVKTRGAYRLVRHPVYACHLLSYAGYAACYPTLRNVLLVLATAAALGARAIIEEGFLARDAAYREYLARVRWRFVPYLH